jgi:hypothetical protein
MTRPVTIHIDPTTEKRLATYGRGLRNGRRLGGEWAAAVDDVAMTILESLGGTVFSYRQAQRFPAPSVPLFLGGSGDFPNGPAPAVHCAKGKSAARLAGTAAGDSSQLNLFRGTP